MYIFVNIDRTPSLYMQAPACSFNIYKAFLI